MNPHDLIEKYYKPDSITYAILLRHAESVARKAVAVARRVQHLGPDLGFVYEAAMLHDIAIFLTYAPKLGCFGRFPYVCHGYLGREILDRMNLPRHALVCERHVGCGITAREIRERKLPLPEREMVPVSLEEQIVCYADKFFSKERDPGEEEKSVTDVISTISQQGEEKGIIFRKWLKIFEI
jgi:uncharacterized protein